MGDLAQADDSDESPGAEDGSEGDTAGPDGPATI